MLPGLSKVEDGREGEEEEEEGQKKKMEDEVTGEIFAGVPRETNAARWSHSESFFFSPQR